MSEQTTVLFHCQHSMGLGHLVRASALCAALARQHRVVLLSGGAFPDGVALPDAVEVVQLPPVGTTTEGKLVTHDPRHSVEQAMELRRDMVVQTFHEVRPAAVIVELFPFGRRKFSTELLALLEAARAAPWRPATVCSVRDLLVGRADKQRAHDDRAREIADRHLDAVLVHADPQFARLEESFRPSVPLRVPVRYTGFVLPERSSSRLPEARGDHLLVSAGGGVAGGPLVRAAVDARRHLSPADLETMRIVAGPFLPDGDWEWLQQAARTTAGLDVVRFVPNLTAELYAAAGSVSQCGYNTAIDLLRTRVPALVVPFTAEGEDEQTRRAQRLAGLGAIQVLDPAALDGRALAEAIVRLRGFTPTPLELQVDGARVTAKAVGELIDARSQPGPQVATKTVSRRRHSEWLDPFRAVLDRRPVEIFFRNDDAGWNDARLFRLMDLFTARELPLDLAVIPAELRPALARELCRRRADAPGLVGMHQHGWWHVNHEPDGRKYEFGPARDGASQRADIAAGARRLKDLLGTVEPIFTPPWNRCTQTTADQLTDLGVRVLSRDVTAPPLALPGLIELPVGVDWFAHRKRTRLTPREFGRHLARTACYPRPLGIMFHHATTDATERATIAELLDVIASHPHARPRLMAESALLASASAADQTPHERPIPPFAVPKEQAS